MSRKSSKTVGKSVDETRQYHQWYFRAISNPLRRKILRALKDGHETIEDLQSNTKLNAKTLKWHLNILEHGFCVEKTTTEGKPVYRLTQEGRVVDYLE